MAAAEDQMARAKALELFMALHRRGLLGPVKYDKPPPGVDPAQWDPYARTTLTGGVRRTRAGGPVIDPLPRRRPSSIFTQAGPVPNDTRLY